ncbi:MAG: T9SS type A sorting domain-containing protein [Saprospiraceae bacterium]|nr:T9SS type A sorting domain-containing protein [Saprospiraceae bacterium]
MKHFFVAAYLLYGAFLAAQTNLERQVLASQGASDRTEHIRLDWTLGEPAVSTLATSSGYMTEGFQQSSIRVEALSHPIAAVPILYDIRVSPNPTAALLSIQFPADMEEELGWTLYDANGKMLQRRAPMVPSDQSIDVSAYPDGIYLLRFADRQGRSMQTYRIVKTK